ncbi:MAG TPA: hypothetical protein VGF88_01065 [Acidobacteriaceae bacterium]|jgi:hypothetical protein
MNQYLFLRRMRGPIILLTFGITAILDEYAGISYAHSWPLYVIVWGLLKLAENAILAQNPPLPGAGYPGYPATPVQGTTGYTSYTGAAPVDATTTTTATIVPPEDTTLRDEGRR